MVTNRFVDEGFAGFPVESVVVRRFAVRSGPAEGSETVIEFDRAAVPIGVRGEAQSPVLRWTPAPRTPMHTRPLSAGLGEVPADADIYQLSLNDKILMTANLQGDGLFLQDETGNHGVIHFFDVSDARHPRRIGPALETHGALHNAAISTDGSQVALQILEDEGRLRRTLVAWVHGAGLSPVQLLDAPRSGEGLQFVRNFLFVGMQDPPLSALAETATTDTIALFDLRRIAK